ncbi:hypothetical protein BDN72DRAFT_892375 [Pluteus cervinus]|uniref:Uncharacterized protein n=1 Tax=Pluteus cervinus TaxID=181527 RepID=A0ACD3BEI5_9AGAR|nr:hypothetical protein BDN72DRAFT_892375 [Pluteus cervinus]
MFANDFALFQHCRDSSGHSCCVDCELVFEDEDELHQHYQDDSDHVYCTQCRRAFVDEHALEQHIRNRPDHNYCMDCNRRFVDNHALQQHNSAVHQRSDTDSEPDLSDASTSYSETSEEDDVEPYCLSCNRRFNDTMSLYLHLANNSRHNWCFICSRDFSSPSALAQHSASAAHRDRSICCPLCGQGFKVPSSIPMHIESGACQEGITRHHVTAAVHNMKIIPSISASRLLTGPTSSVYRMQPAISYIATEQAFTGTAFECYLCHKQFKQLRALNAHLDSAAHDDDEFKCPNRRCNKEFTLISALIQHIESEACGVARFRQVERLALDLSAKFSRLLTN